MKQKTEINQQTELHLQTLCAAPVPLKQYRQQFNSQANRSLLLFFSVFDLHLQFVVIISGFTGLLKAVLLVCVSTEQPIVLTNVMFSFPSSNAR